MHGRPRKPASWDDAASLAKEKEEEEAKVSELEALLAQVLLNHRNRCYTKEALRQNARLLEINPEVYTAWNFRKLAVKHLMSQQDEGAGKAILDEELQLVERALKRNYKSYGAWYHRKWVIGFGLSPLDHEFQLLGKLLVADDRNFHGWNYRRFLVSVKDVPEGQELQYTTKKINENFSNYSAWHNRSALLSNLFKGKLKEKGMQQQILTEEYELVIQAFFTEPDDQSGWFYHLWLLDQTVAQSGPQLTGSWPLNDSALTMSMDEYSKSFIWGFRCPLTGCHCFLDRFLYISLCFSEPVTGVSEDTVKLNSIPDLQCFCRLQWTPLFACTTGISRIWVAKTSSSVEIEDCIIFSFEMEVGGVPGIYSKDGRPFSSPNLIKFTVEKIAVAASIHCDEPPAVSPLSWPSENPVFLERCSSVAGHNGKKGEPEARSDTGLEWQIKALKSQIDICRQLLSIEQNSKWAKLTLARLLRAYNNVVNPHHVDSKCVDEVRQLFKDLINIDPAHVHYYEDQLSLLLMNKITYGFCALKEYWLKPEESDTGRLNGTTSNGWLSLHGLSLSRLGCLEKLLWVQRLDLSHNMLRSLDGLEGLQLLVCLDVSHNLISHVTALAPIRSIRSLLALNVAHNEIGRHTIDTSRYCLPSILNNMVENDRGENKDASQLIHWEVAALFKGMQLKQLIILGNPMASDDICRQKIIESLPSLVWFDGLRTL